MKTGEVLHMSIYGHRERVRVLRVLSFGTVDVERLSDGRCFRVSGLTFWFEGDERATDR